MTKQTLPPGRRDWDYVAFADYQSDMKESAVTARAVIEYMSKCVADAERALAEVVIAAGGSVKIYDDVIRDPHRRTELTIDRHEYDRTIEFRARVSLGKQSSDKEG